ncbi:MAG: SDR family oxidoreductase [Planctomycetota bacterium]
MKKLVFGAGYLGYRVAQLWRNQGDDVWIVTRRAAWARELEAHGYHPLVADLTKPDDLGTLPAVDSVLFAVGFDRNQFQTIRDVYVNGWKNVLEVLSSVTGRMLYVSSTGVYGAAEGEWVHEETVCNPRREGAVACLEAEQLLSGYPLAANSIIFRCAGIYGPGRVPHLAALRAGEPLAVSPAGYLNLIHVDDAAAIIVQAETHLATPELLNVADGNPVIRADYYSEIARLCGLPSPTFAATNAASPAQQRALADKRVSNQRLQERLLFPFRYPSYREGLAAILRVDAEGVVEA